MFRLRRGGSRKGVLTMLAGLLALTAVSRSASAEEPATCKKVRARAAADAAVLMSPTALAQGIKFPENRMTDAGATVASRSQYQVRIGLSMSPIDVYKGLQIEQAAEADCEQQRAREAALDVLGAGTDAARLPALRKAIAFLDEHESERAQIVEKTDERLAAQVITLVDAADVQKRVSALRRMRAQLAGEARRLEQHLPASVRARLESGRAPGEAPLAQLVANADGAAMKYEQQVAHVRSLEPWTVQVMGGIVPQDAPLDWYGMVTLGFNFGAFGRNANESKYLAAREDELRTSRDEVADKARLLGGDVAETARATRDELAATDEQASRLATGRAALEKAAAPAALHTLAVLTLEQELVDAERVLLKVFAEELGRMEESNHGRK